MLFFRTDDRHFDALLEMSWCQNNHRAARHWASVLTISRHAIGFVTCPIQTVDLSRLCNIKGCGGFGRRSPSGNSLLTSLILLHHDCRAKVCLGLLAPTEAGCERVVIAGRQPGCRDLNQGDRRSGECARDLAVGTPYSYVLGRSTVVCYHFVSVNLLLRVRAQ